MKITFMPSSLSRMQMLLQKRLLLLVPSEWVALLRPRSLNMTIPLTSKSTLLCLSGRETILLKRKILTSLATLPTKTTLLLTQLMVSSSKPASLRFKSTSKRTSHSLIEITTSNSELLFMSVAETLKKIYLFQRKNFLTISLQAVMSSRSKRLSPLPSMHLSLSLSQATTFLLILLSLMVRLKELSTIESKVPLRLTPTRT